MSTGTAKQPDGLTTRWSTIIAAAVLVAATMAIVVLIFQLIPAIDVVAVEVPWSNQKNLTIKGGPGRFWYDSKNGLLRYQGIITDDARKSLDGLLDGGDDAAYHEAVGEMAFRSHQAADLASHWILVVAGLAGVMGVQIRSLFDFIGNACYKRSLDVIGWWPWYVLRPVLGFLVSVLVIVLVKVDLLMVGKRTDDSFWWLGLAALAGFGVTDVIGRLRLVSKTLFGSENDAGDAPNITRKHAEPATAE